jgi:D-methionine transport system substrate-binding protein
MKNIARILLLAVVLLAALPFAAFAASSTKLVIGLTPYLNGDIVRMAMPLLDAEGYDVEIRDFIDNVMPNIALADGSISANLFQDIPYLENMVREQKFDLVWVTKVYIEPLGLYSRNIEAIDGIKDGDSIAIPNDPVNGSRALRLLEKAGLIKFGEGNSADSVTVSDITENDKDLKIIELDAADMTRALDDTTVSVINANYAVEANIIPARDALMIEDKDSPHAIVVAVRRADADKPETKALVKALNSPEVKKFIEDYLALNGIVPAF